MDSEGANIAAPIKRAPRRSRTEDTRAERARALVLVPVFKSDKWKTAPASTTLARHVPDIHSPGDRLAEATGLAQAIDLDVVDSLIIPIGAPRPSTLIGSGKVEEIKGRVADEKIDLVIVDHAITPGQQKSLEKTWNAKVLDRTGLILEIFGSRAKTKEGVLQVELAHLTYQKSRLVRAWTHLERQRGGAGFLGGPGEAQIELDRRMLQDRIDAIKKDLVDVVRTRELHRAGRRKIPFPIVAIVGYTNAGKSTLFNKVTGANVLAKDQVFATLDPTMRELKLSSGRRIILSDTVGFISDLPTTLVAAFRATLEEVIEADLILHVRDIAHRETEAQARDVDKVLGDLGIDMQKADGHILEVWNKIDLFEPEQLEEALKAARFEERRPALVSAITGEGLELLSALIDQRLGISDEILNLVIPAREGRLISWLHENADVLERSSDAEGDVVMRVRVATEKKDRLEAAMKKAGL
ncbi:MAG: GTPase HflX [Hyphomicrobium sp.]